MLVSLNINDEPVGYSPPVGPAVRFTVRYNQREANQPANFSYSNFGPKWTFDWLSYITDKPSSPTADVNYYIMGGGTRTFTGFDSGTQTFAFQQFDQTKLTRTSPDTYEMLSRDGTRKIFSQSDGSDWEPSRKIFLTQLIDPHGNAVSLTYDDNASPGRHHRCHRPGHHNFLRSSDRHLQDHQGHRSLRALCHLRLRCLRPAHQDHRRHRYRRPSLPMMHGDGSKSRLHRQADNALWRTTFTKSESPATLGRWRLSILMAIGTESNITSPLILASRHRPAQNVPVGMLTYNEFLDFRNTYYWSKIAYAAAYPDYTKAKIYHWLHSSSAIQIPHRGILESVKEPLEGRVWYDYAGQSGPHSSIMSEAQTSPPMWAACSMMALPSFTPMNTMASATSQKVDPVGRTFSYTLRGEWH